MHYIFFFFLFSVSILHGMKQEHTLLYDAKRLNDWDKRDQFYYDIYLHVAEKYHINETDETTSKEELEHRKLYKQELKKIMTKSRMTQPYNFNRIVAQQNYEFSKLLLEFGANPNDIWHEYAPPIYLARTVKLAELLVGYKVNLNVEAVAYPSVLISSIMENCPTELTQFYLEKGVSPNREKGRDNGLHWLCFFSKDEERAFEFLEKAKLLIQHNVEINAVGPDNRTPLDYLVRSESPNPLQLQLVTLLKENGARTYKELQEEKNKQAQ